MQDEQRLPLAGQVAIVTGASGGIGSATAIALAQAGASVLVHYHQRRALALQTMAACHRLGGRATLVQADLSTQAGVHQLLAAARTLGRVQVLVNNAGQSLTSLLMDTTLDEWNGIMAANLTTAFLCTQAILPDMIQQKYGRIIQVSSVWGMVGGACEAAYSAAKAGIIAMTKATAKEVGACGVTLNVVAPGAVETSMLDDLSPLDRVALVAEIPANRLGTPTEIAQAITFLAHPKSGYMTGQVLSPNGGWVL